MNRRRLVRLAAAAALLAGCGDVVKHEFTVSDALRHAPVRSILVMEPGWNPKVKRRNPDDFMHMKTDVQPVSALRIREIFNKVLSASLTVDTAYQADAAARQWGTEIGFDLSRNRIPLAVEPHPLPAEAVLLLGVQNYGWEKASVQVQFLWFTKKDVGPPKYAHRVKIQAILVNPRTGEVLFDALEGQEETAESTSEELVDQLTASVAAEIATAFPPAPGGVTPPPATAPSTPPSPAPSGTSF